MVGEGGGGGGSMGRNGFDLVIGVCEGTVGTEELHSVVLWGLKLRVLKLLFGNGERDERYWNSEAVKLMSVTGDVI